MAAGHARPPREDQPTALPDGSRARTGARRRWQLLRAPLAIALVFLLGVLVLLYPAMSSWFAQYQQSQQVVGYAQDVQDLGREGRRAALAAARRYNEALTGGAVVNAFTRLPVADDHQRPFVYDSLLAADDHGLMARVRIPTIDVDLPVFHGTSEQVLLEGIGHLQGTALPVGGPGAHSVLTGHRGLAEATILTHLDEVELTDRFTIETFGEVLTYEVIATAVVEPDETHALRPQPGKDLVTLVTCTPIGVNSHRILVTAERIVPTPVEDVDAAGEQPHVPRFPWWALAVGGTVIALSAYVWSSGRGATTPGP